MLGRETHLERSPLGEPMAWSPTRETGRRSAAQSAPGGVLPPNVPASVFAERERSVADGESARLTPSARMRQFGVAPESLTDEPLLGRYRILELRDVGGFGSVLVCWDVRLQRRVAVKCLPLELGASAVTLDEALAEARASSFLAHPNIVTVHDFEVEGAWAYLVMEYVDGVTLAELQARVEGGVLVFDEAAYVLQCLASALAFAHANGVLHLDIKPQNVMIDRSGQVKLGDFGMASLASAAGWGGARGGTVGYMAPEQLEGELVDERSDVFSLATVLYEALSGQAPFRAASAEASLRLIEKGATPIEALEPELDEEIARTLMAALSPDAAQRPSSVMALANILLGNARPGRRPGADPALPGLEEAGYSLTRPALGDPTAGLASIRRLMDQTADEGAELEDEALGSLDPPGRRIPALAHALGRTVSAVTTFAALLLASPAFGVAPDALLSWEGSWPYLVICGAAAVLAAVWTPLGSILAIVGAAIACLVGGLTPPALALALALLGAGLAWWLLFGRSGRLTSAAFLAPAVLGCPPAASGLAGYALRPLAALATGALAPAFAEVVMVATANGWAGEATALALAGRFGAPGVWILMGASGLGAWLCSLITKAAAKRKASSWLAFEMRLGATGKTASSAAMASAADPDADDWPSAGERRPSSGRAIATVAQIAATACAVGGYTFGEGLENGGIYAPPAASVLIVALVFLALMLLVVYLFGPAEEPGGGREERRAHASSVGPGEGAGS